MGIKRRRIIFMSGTIVKEWTDDLYKDIPTFLWCSGGKNGRRNEMKHIARPSAHLYIAEHNYDMEEKAI